MDLRTIIKDHLSATGISKALLLRRLGERVKRQTLYDFLNGKSPANSRVIECILNELGLVVTTRTRTPSTEDVRRVVQEVFEQHAIPRLSEAVAQVIAGNEQRKAERLLSMPGHMLQTFQRDMEMKIKSGATDEEIIEWLDTHYPERIDLVHLIRRYVAGRSQEGGSKAASSHR